MKNFYEKQVITLFEQISHGFLSLKFPDQRIRFFGDQNSQLRAEITVNDATFFRELALRGDIGFGETYEKGIWDSDDLLSLISLLLKNKDTLHKQNSFRIKLGRAFLINLEKIAHWFKQNTVKQSKKNIHEHYDLGNPFYELFLDSSMTYSSAFFSHKNQSLVSAQKEKYDRICRKLNLKPGMKVLEIGCGWGGFSEHLANHYDCSVTGVTISQEQYEYATKRMIDSGLQGQVEIKLQDYRKLDGKFDRIVSIEMIEAVGHKFLPEYFSSLNELLLPDGLIAIQAILCPDSLYSNYLKRVDWLRKNIFPGGHLPSLKAILEAIEEKGSKLDIYHFESFGTHYAKTLKEWHVQFNQNWKEIENLGFDDAFRKKWNLYLKMCESAFLERHINVGQFILGHSDQLSYKFEDHEQALNQSYYTTQSQSLSN